MIGRMGIIFKLYLSNYTKNADRSDHGDWYAESLTDTAHKMAQISGIGNRILASVPKRSAIPMLIHSNSKTEPGSKIIEILS